PQRLGQHGIGQPLGRQPLIMQQAREAFDGGFLIAQAAGQRGLIPGLFLNDRVHESGDPFELVAMCPGEHIRDILLEARSPRVLGWHNPRLSRGRTRGYSPPNECVLTSAFRPLFWQLILVSSFLIIAKTPDFSPKESIRILSIESIPFGKKN